jgi:hypothetical protein
MEFWKANPAAWDATRVDCQAPSVAMPAYSARLKSLPGKPVFAGYPAAFDFMFVYWYLMRFAGESPFSHSALNVKTFAMAMLRLPYRDSTKRNMPRRWKEDLTPHACGAGRRARARQDLLQDACGEPRCWRRERKLGRLGRVRALTRC